MGVRDTATKTGSGFERPGANTSVGHLPMGLLRTGDSTTHGVPAALTSDRLARARLASWRHRKEAGNLIFRAQMRRIAGRWREACLALALAPLLLACSEVSSEPAADASSGPADAPLTDGGPAVDATVDATRDAATDAPTASVCVSGEMGPAGGSLVHFSGAKIV